MVRLCGFLPAWWFFQIPATQYGSKSIFEYGIGIGMALLIAALWREDRKSRIDAQAYMDKNYATLVGQLKDIISGNTTAMTTLSDRLVGKISNCPLGSDPIIGAWMRTWVEQGIEHQKRSKLESED